MTQKTRAAAFAFGAALSAAAAALAQVPPASATPPPASAQPAPGQNSATPPWDRTKQIPPPTISPTDPAGSQPTYSVNPPPDGPSGVYLPAAVLGYAKSTAGCVVVGCNDGPEVTPATGPSTSGPDAATPPSSRPTNKGP
jgi:hypothetical protein